MFDNTGKAGNWLRAVAATSANRLAVGHYGDYLGFSGAPSRSLILSWDGSLWSIDPTQPVGLEDRLYGVARAEGFCHHIKKEPITEMLIARDAAD